ncbi:penicillin acylase family protein, partial [Pseudomonas sp. KHB2.9]
VSGSSYLQIVTFDANGPRAQGLLTFSLSSNPASKYAKDQTHAFSEKNLHALPFSEAQIKADPQYHSQVIKE